MEKYQINSQITGLFLIFLCLKTKQNKMYISFSTKLQSQIVLQIQPIFTISAQI